VKFTTGEAGAIRQPELEAKLEGSGRIKLRHCSNVHVAAEVTARRIASAPSASTQQGTAPANAAGVDDALAASASVTLAVSERYIAGISRW